MWESSGKIVDNVLKELIASIFGFRKTVYNLFAYSQQSIEVMMVLGLALR